MDFDERIALEIHPDIIARQESYLNHQVHSLYGTDYTPTVKKCRSFNGHNCQTICDHGLNHGMCTECWLKVVYQVPKMPKRYSGARLTAWPGQELAYSKLGSWINKARNNIVGNLFLLGNAGAGKTHAACALLHEYSLTFRSCYYANLTDLLDEWGNAKNGFIVKGDIKLLVIDEVTGYQINKKSKEEDFLYRLSTHRWEKNLPTVYISNLSQTEIMDKFHERTISRMFAGSPDVISFSGIEDYRGQE